MVTRIFLVLAIVAGAAGFFLTHTQLADKLAEMKTARESAEQEKQTAVTEKNTVQAKLTETETKLDTTTKERDQAQGDLKVAQETIEKEKQTTEGVRGELAKSKAETVKVRAENKEYDTLKKDLKLNASDIRKAVADLKQKTKDLDISNKEKDVLSRTANKLAAELKVLKSPYEKVELPAGLKGKIIAVDPKWSFVVLDIGEKQGALKNGELLIVRNDNLIGKVRIESVAADRCIANILPSWKKDDVVEGDAVVY